MTPCPDENELLEWEQGRLSADAVARLEAHLDGCAACSVVVAGLAGGGGLPAEGPEQLPLAVDYASYDGQPALAVVLPDPEPTTVSVFVVGPGCSAQDDRTLFFFRAPRP